MHATMNVYNAFCDRVPVIVIGGNDLDAAHRPPGVPTVHSAQDINAIVRDYTKWDDTPVSAQHFAQSFVRAYQDRDHAALRAGHDLARRRLGSRSRSATTARSSTFRNSCRRAPPQGEHGRGARSGAASGQRRAPGDRRRPRGQHAERHQASGAARRAVAGAGGAPARPAEFPDHPSISAGRRP